ncbi:MAG: hypothetical protein JW841_12150 [Deltaproteobacteria bacterium]|nr:hypothetical protein [Deltaproteobacteria bacterium]
MSIRGAQVMTAIALTKPGVALGLAGTDAKGNGIVHEHRLYQLIRQKNLNHDHVIKIEFLDKGVQAFAFTFG